MSLPRLIALLLFAITLVVYIPVRGFMFVSYDDFDYIINNEVVKGGLTVAGIKWAFTNGYSANWHPLTWISHMVDCELFKLNPGAHHSVNVLIHAGNAVLLFGLLLRLTKELWPSAFVAFLFALHPLHVESVAWVAERKEMLSTFFGLLTMSSYARYAERRSYYHYGFALFWYACGLMSKPMLVTMPFLLLLIDYWPLQRFSSLKIQRQILLEKIPFCFLAAVSCLITLKVQQKAMPSEPFPLWFRLENAVLSICHYLSKTLWPDHFSVLYPYKPISLASFCVLGMLVCGITVAAWLMRDRNRGWLVGWLWFLGTLVPVLGIVQVGGAGMADRYLYFPSIGIFIAIIYGLSAPNKRRPVAKKHVIAAALAVFVICVALTEKQLSYWQNTGTLFHHVLEVAGESDVAHDSLGFFLERQGHYEEALAEYCHAVTLNPGYIRYHFHIGHVLEELGRPAAALGEYQQCLGENPTNAFFHLAAGNALVALGQIPVAMSEFDRAEKLDAGLAWPYIGAANAMLRQGEVTNAVAKLWEAVRVEPRNFETLSTVARVMATYPDAAIRDGPNAVILATKANEFANGLQPDVLDACGMAFAETGDFTNAIAYAANARQLDELENSETSGPVAKAIDLHWQSYRDSRPWREPFIATNTIDNL